MEGAQDDRAGSMAGQAAGRVQKSQAVWHCLVGTLAGLSPEDSPSSGKVWAKVALTQALRGL